MKRVLITAALCFCLSACGSHHNSLTAANSKDVGKLLLKASIYAEDKLNLFSGGDGDMYGSCMDNYSSYEKDQQQQCQKIYSLMVEYAQKIPEFKGITVADITNRKVYQDKLKAAYYHESMYGEFSDQKKG